MDQTEAGAGAATNRPAFDYDEAFNRNLGWVTAWEQQALRSKTVAIAGMGGVGGAHLLTLARLGIGAFHIADLDVFELANFNRQAGAMQSTLGRPKVEVLAEMARDINPGIRITTFPRGVDDGNVDAFLQGVDLFVDGLDFFVLDIRAKVFGRCAELGIPAITAAPIGMGAAYLIFMPGGMSFERYFRLQGQPEERQYVNFLVGLVPKGYHRRYVMDPWRIDLAGKRGPSTAMSCQLCAGVTGVEAVRILLRRGGVRAVPWYHHFDPYLGRWKRGWLPGGNLNPLQTLKRHIAYKVYGRLSRQKGAATAATPQTEMERILDLARWAPSGDNAQPWRFEIRGDDQLTVWVPAGSRGHVYEYNDGQPTLISAGILLETLRIAASSFGRSLDWDYRGIVGDRHAIDVSMPRSDGVRPDPLRDFVPMRSVNRFPCKTDRLTAVEKNALESCLGPELTVRWFETLSERWQWARLGALASDIRLRIPEAYQVHRAMLDWEHDLSPTGIPAGAVGLSPVALRMMRWALQDWSRVDRMNRIFGTGAARLEMDLLPGVLCAGHFAVALRQPAPAGVDAPALLRTGMSMQRFWLTATRLGLTLQPQFSILTYACYARHGVAFTADAGIRRKADDLNRRFAAAAPGDQDAILFLGRIGWPRSRRERPRSVRRPWNELILGEDSAATGDKELRFDVA